VVVGFDRTPRLDNLVTVRLSLFWVSTWVPLLWVSTWVPLLGFQVENSSQQNAFAIRTALVLVTDEQGVPLQGLGQEDFEIAETGVRRDVVEVVGDGAGQEIFLLVDTGAGFREGIPSLRKGIEAFAAKLREPHEVLLADFGGGVHHLAGPTSDPSVLARAAGRLAAGMEGTFLLDAIAHVCSGVTASQPDAESPVVVIVTSLTPDASSTPMEEAYRLGKESQALFYVFLYDPLYQASYDERRAHMEEFLKALAEGSGGGFMKVQAPSTLPDRLGALGTELVRPFYRVSFLTEVEPRTVLEQLSVNVAKQGAKALLIRLLREEQIVLSRRPEEPSQ